MNSSDKVMGQKVSTQIPAMDPTDEHTLSGSQSSNSSSVTNSQNVGNISGESGVYSAVEINNNEEIKRDDLMKASVVEDTGDTEKLHNNKASTSPHMGVHDDSKSSKSITDSDMHIKDNIELLEITGENNEKAGVEAKPEIAQIDLTESPKRKHSVTDQEAPKKKKQTQLTFASANGKGSLTLKLNFGSRSSASKGSATEKLPVTKHEVVEVLETSHKDQKKYDDLSDRAQSHHVYKKPLQSVPVDVKPKDVAAKPKPVSSHTLPHASKVTLHLKPMASRTTIIHEKSKQFRQYPGPLVALNYDLYDDNLINAPANASIASEKLAFGFPTINKPWLLDIAYIITFLSLFRGVVQTDPLGPVDFEKGLGLENTEEKRTNRRSTRLSDPSNVSPAMDDLFRKLLALVLNRKKPIARDGQKSALQELKSKYITFGLPSEWRDDTELHKTSKIECDVSKDRVDGSRPEISSEETVEFEAPQELMNPFHEKGFETHGIAGIESADDRCIMMRCLAQWALSESTVIKQYFTDSLNAPDASGERDTSYASRALLRGFPHAIEMRKDLERKYVKKPQSKLDSPEPFPRYLDPTSNPSEHPLAFRFNEFIVGDCGFHIGRFYLVKMAEPSSGKVASLDQMKTFLNDSSGMRTSTCSGFALYVEDVHTMLTESLQEFGLEFKDGQEVKSNVEFDESNYWHCVASNCDELEGFLAHVSVKLGIAEKSTPAIPPGSVSYNATLHMYHYLSSLLPRLVEMEDFRASSAGLNRASRRKRVEYVAPVLSDHEEAGEVDEQYSDVEEQDDEYLD